MMRWLIENPDAPTLASLGLFCLVLAARAALDLVRSRRRQRP